MSAQSQTLVSVVTPVYNEEEHLAECIESVLAQTYKNWDYTIVNNCSTDRSLEIARRYAEKDPRIRIHNNERFLPMLANLNIAVRQISPASKYCKMVLGDDSILPRCLEQMVAVADANPSVGIVSAYLQGWNKVGLTGLPREQTIVNGTEACRQFLLEKLLLFGSQNSVLYRADLVRSRDPFYVETEMYADFESCFALLQKSDLGFVHEVLTVSRLRSSSVGRISADLGTPLASRLGFLFTYGQNCLTEQEFKVTLDRLLNQYYSFLGRRLFVERDPSFWSYHKQNLSSWGIPFRRSRLATAAFAEFCGFVLKPKSTLRSIKRLFQLKKIRKPGMRKIVSNFGASAPAKPAPELGDSYRA